MAARTPSKNGNLAFQDGGAHSPRWQLPLCNMAASRTQDGGSQQKMAAPAPKMASPSHRSPLPPKMAAPSPSHPAPLLQYGGPLSPRWRLPHLGGHLAGSDSPCLGRKWAEPGREQAAVRPRPLWGCASYWTEEQSVAAMLGKRRGRGFPRPRPLHYLLRGGGSAPLGVSPSLSEEAVASESVDRDILCHDMTAPYSTAQPDVT